MEIKYLRITKVGISRVVRISEDGETWLSPEEHYKLVGDYDIKLSIFGDGLYGSHLNINSNERKEKMT